MVHLLVRIDEITQSCETVGLEIMFNTISGMCLHRIGFLPSESEIMHMEILSRLLLVHMSFLTHFNPMYQCIVFANSIIFLLMYAFFMPKR